MCVKKKNKKTKPVTSIAATPLARNTRAHAQAYGRHGYYTCGVGGREERAAEMYGSVPPPEFVGKAGSTSHSTTNEGEVEEPKAKPRHVHEHQWKVYRSRDTFESNVCNEVCNTPCFTVGSRCSTDTYQDLVFMATVVYLVALM